MGDRIDDLMTKIWPKLQREVTVGLALKPGIDKYLPLDSLKESEPYRLIPPPEWDDSPAIETAGAEGPSMRRFKTLEAFEGAYELSVQLDVTIGMLGDAEESLLIAAKDFGERARLSERRAILHLLDDGNPIGRFDRAAIMEAVRRYRFHGPCRLVVKNTGDTSEDAKKRGLVDDVVDAKGQLPRTVVALLLPLYLGPTMHRVVDDLTTTWMRNPDGGGVTLTLSERFFLDRPNHAVRFSQSVE